MPLLIIYLVAYPSGLNKLTDMDPCYRCKVTEEEELIVA